MYVIIHWCIVTSLGSPFKINKLQQFSLSRHVFNVQSLVAVIPSSLCAEPGSHDFVDGCDHLEQPISILVNISGKILMIQQDQSAYVEKSKVYCTDGLGWVGSQPLCWFYRDEIGVYMNNVLLN